MFCQSVAEIFGEKALSGLGNLIGVLAIVSFAAFQSDIPVSLIPHGSFDLSGNCMTANLFYSLSWTYLL